MSFSQNYRYHDHFGKLSTQFQEFDHQGFSEKTRKCYLGFISPFTNLCAHGFIATTLHQMGFIVYFLRRVTTSNENLYVWEYLYNEEAASIS